MDQATVELLIGAGGSLLIVVFSYLYATFKK